MIVHSRPTKYMYKYQEKKNEVQNITCYSNVVKWLKVLRINEKWEASACLNNIGPNLNGDYENKKPSYC